MSRTRSAFLPSFALLVVAGSVPAGAQQRVDVNTSRPRQQSESEAPVRRLRAQLDSLAQRYSDEDITLVDRRRIETEIARVVERLQEAMDHGGAEMKARVMLRAPSAPQTLVAPRGWIGIVVEGPGMEPRVENGELVVRYLSYPRIVSVDPSSPAQVAGIVPNDTLLAYDGRDVRENDINLNKLLKPASRVNVKLRRDGRTREVPVVIAETPSRIALRRSDEARGDLMPGMSAQEGMIIRMPMPPQGGMARGSTVRLAPSAPNAPVAAPGTPVFSFSLGSSGVAGASLVTITEGLGKRFGVSNGVLVTVVPQGSPAAQSGLEDGDVIVRVSNQAVRTVNDVRRAVGSAWENGQRSVDLELLRDNKTVKLALRW